MSIVDCTCKGINPDCERCFGRGYYDTDITSEHKRIFVAKDNKEVKNSDTDKELPFSQKVKSLAKLEIEKLIRELIKSIDAISKAQSQILDTISFRKRAVYTISRNNLEKIYLLETKKKYLKTKLEVACNQAFFLKCSVDVKYNHSFSTKNIDTFSTKELKYLRRKFHKIKRRKNNSIKK